MGKVQKPLHQYNEEGGGCYPRNFEDGTRDHTNLKGVPFMPSKGLYYPGADLPMTPGIFYGQRLILVDVPEEKREYLIKDIMRIPETSIEDISAQPMPIVTNTINLVELQNLLQNDYQIPFRVMRRKDDPERSAIVSSLHKLANYLMA